MIHAWPVRSGYVRVPVLDQVDLFTHGGTAMAAVQWYYRIMGEVIGPVSPAELRRLAQRGVVDSNTPVRKGEHGKWVLAERVKGLCFLRTPPAQPSPPVTPPSVQPSAPVSAQATSDASNQQVDGRGTAARLKSVGLAPWIATGSAVLLVVVISGWLLVRSLYDGPPESVADAPSTTVVHKPVVGNPPADENPFRAEDVVKRCTPAVVTIKTDRGLGSGFLVSSDGRVLTNYHVIEGAHEAQVVLADGSRLEVLGWTNYSVGDDLALLRIREVGGQFTGLRFAQQAPVQGEKVLAFGSPQGFFGSVTDGLVSAVRSDSEVRNLVPGYETRGYSLDVEWVQTSAATSRGNSGGPLVNLRGEVVGVNSWSHRGGENLNFAISARHAAAFVAHSPNEYRALSKLPPPRPDPQQLPKQRRQEELRAEEKRQAAERQEQLNELRRIVSEHEVAAQDRQRQSIEAAEKRQRRAIQAAKQIQSAVKRQRELDRLNGLIQQIRTEVAVIGSDLAALRQRGGTLMAQAAQVATRADQITARLVAINRRLVAIGQAIQRRQIAGNRGPIFLDGESAPFNQSGIQQLRTEAAALQAAVPGLTFNRQTLEGNMAGIVVQAQSLKAQFDGKERERASRMSELNALVDKYDALTQ